MNPADPVHSSAQLCTVCSWQVSQPTGVRSSAWTSPILGCGSDCEAKPLPKPANELSTAISKTKVRRTNSDMAPRSILRVDRGLAWQIDPIVLSLKSHELLTKQQHGVCSITLKAVMRHHLFSLLFALLVVLASIGHGALESGTASQWAGLSDQIEHTASHGGQVHTHLHSSADHSQTEAQGPTSQRPCAVVIACNWRLPPDASLLQAIYSSPERPPRA